MTYLHKTKTRHFTTFTVYIFSNIPRNSEDLKHLRYHLFFFSSNLEVVHGFFRLFLCSVSVFTVDIVVYFLLLVVCLFLRFFQTAISAYDVLSEFFVLYSQKKI